MGTETFFGSGISLDHAESAVGDIIRSLLARTEVLYCTTTNAQTNTEVEQIVLDVDVDGARYLLIRLPAVDRPQIQLSPREQEIVRMVAQGHPNKIIADVLGISAWTVCTHLRRIFAKLGVSSRAAMVARLFQGRGGRSEKSSRVQLRSSARAG
jgi:DNA-binding CsgD family transcriptional regulator